MCFSLRIDSQVGRLCQSTIQNLHIEYHKTAEIATKSPRHTQFFHVFHTLDAPDEV